MDKEQREALERQDRERERLKKRIAKAEAKYASLRRDVDEIEKHWRGKGMMPEGRHR